MGPRCCVLDLVCVWVGFGWLLVFVALGTVCGFLDGFFFCCIFFVHFFRN